MIYSRSLLYLIHIVLVNFQDYGRWSTSEFCLCLISCELICEFRSNFVYALVLTRCRFWWLNNIFRSFSTVLWPLIDVKILFMLNILWINWWILIQFCKCNLGKDHYKLFFINFQLSYGPWLMSEFCFHSVSWEQIEGFWWNFVHAVVLARSRWECIIFS